jgi:hypothetical protein
MTNPLIEKFYELHPEKKETPNNLPPVTTEPYNPSANTKASTSIKSYDVHSVSDSFFQVAEKIKKGTAKVTCMNTEYDTIGHFSMGVKVTFEVYVYDF